MQKNWLRIGAVSVGMLMANPFSFAQRIFPQPPPPQAQGQMQHWSVNMNDVPQAAQSALYDLAAGQPITQVWMFRRGNFVYYKAQLADGASIHVTPDGQSLDQQQMLGNQPPPPAYYGNWGNAWDHFVRAETNGVLERVRGDQVPGQVWQAINSVRGNDPVDDVMRVNYNNQSYYRVDLGGNDPRTLRIGPDGRILYNENFSAPGHRRVDFGDLPHDVKETLRREAGGRPIDRISEVYRNGRTLYLARIEGREHVRMLLINRRGEVVREHGGEHGPWRLEPWREHERR